VLKPASGRDDLKAWQKSVQTLLWIGRHTAQRISLHGRWIVPFQTHFSSCSSILTYTLHISLRF
jgi:hypothetical protein